MNVYRMSVEQLALAVHHVSGLAVEIGDEHPEAAALMMDACKIGIDEIATHMCKGDRELAAKITVQLGDEH